MRPARRSVLRTMCLMPEAPELETLKRQVAPFLPLRVESVSLSLERALRHPDSLPLEALVGETFVKVTRTGKWLILHGANHSLWVHLRMSGRLRWCDPADALEKHTHASLRVGCATGLADLRFIDPRTFGELRVLKPGAQLSKVTDVQDAARAPHDGKACSNTMAIKAVFLDQSRFVQGIGNYLADEVCHTAGIDPNTQSSSLSKAQWADLSQAASDCFEVFAKARGTALKDEGWKDLFGELGGGGDLLKVHAKSKCGTCFGPVSKGKIAGRSSYWCQVCQPAIKAL